MKNRTKVFAILLALLTLCAILSVSASAKEFEYCGLCKGSGEYHCQWCGNTGKALCTLCGGTGGEVCDECGGDGYLVCPSCGGDGVSKPVPENGDPIPCGQCEGNGKLRCIKCHTKAGWLVCTRCDGEGYEVCQGCIPARAIGYKCPNCKGTGFLGVGFDFPPEWNDGTRNTPIKGDHIIIDAEWHYIVYGGDGTVQPTAEPTSAMTPKPTATATSRPDEGTKPDDGTPDPSEPAGEPADAPPADPALVPKDRGSDFDVPASGNTAHAAASVSVEIGRMSNEEQARYAALSDNEIAQILRDVRAVVETAEPGRSAPGMDDLLNAVTAQSGFSSPREARVYPLYFDGHAEIGFPVRVTVRLKAGDLNGGSELYVYHVREDGGVDPLGRAEYSTFEDGSVETITFTTDSFSGFFTADRDLDLERIRNPEPADADAAAPGDADGAANGASPLLPIVLLCAAVAAAAAAIAGTAAVRRKKNGAK